MSEHSYSNITDNLKTSFFNSFIYEIFKENEGSCENFYDVEIYDKSN